MDEDVTVCPHCKSLILSAEQYQHLQQQRGAEHQAKAPRVPFRRLSEREWESPSTTKTT